MANTNAGHLHPVIDTDTHFLIDPDTREITNEQSVHPLMQGDHCSQRFTFEIPRLPDGHDLSLCNVAQIHYINVDHANKNNVSKDIYEADDLVINSNNEKMVTLSWLVSGNATKYAGLLSFVIKFKCIEDGKKVYEWNTEVYSGISVSSGIDNSEEIVEEYSDVLEQWRQELFEYSVSIDERIAKALEDYFAEHPIETGSTATIGTVNLIAANWVGDRNLYSQIVSIDGVTENSQVDLTPSVEQLVIFYEKDLTFVTENDGGVVTVYAIGQKPEHDYTIQVTITEVSA